MHFDVFHETQEVSNQESGVCLRTQSPLLGIYLTDAYRKYPPCMAEVALHLKLTLPTTGWL